MFLDAFLNIRDCSPNENRIRFVITFSYGCIQLIHPHSVFKKIHLNQRNKPVKSLVTTNAFSDFIMQGLHTCESCSAGTWEWAGCVDTRPAVLAYRSLTFVDIAITCCTSVSCSTLTLKSYKIYNITMSDVWGEFLCHTCRTCRTYCMRGYFYHIRANVKRIPHMDYSYRNG